MYAVLFYLLRKIGLMRRIINLVSQSKLTKEPVTVNERAGELGQRCKSKTT